MRSLTSLASRFTELPIRVRVPPSTVAKESGSSTLEGEIPRRWHQLSSTGSRAATIGVLGTKADTGPTTVVTNKIIRRGLRIASEPSRALSRSRPPARNRPAERANRPIRVITAGLPKPRSASAGLSTPVAISRPAANRQVTSGASQPLTNSSTDPASTNRVMTASGWMPAGKETIMAGPEVSRGVTDYRTLGCQGIPDAQAP